MGAILLIKKIFVFLSILSVVFVPFFSSKALTVNDREYRSLETGEVEYINETYYTPISINADYGGKTIDNIQQYMIYNGLHGLNIVFPSPLSLSMYFPDIDILYQLPSNVHTLVFGFDTGVAYYYYYMLDIAGRIIGDGLDDEIILQYSDLSGLEVPPNTMILIDGIIDDLDHYQMGYDTGYDEGLDYGQARGYNSGYSYSRSIYGYYYNNDWRTALEWGDLRYNEGLITQDATGFGALLGSIFTGLGSLLAIELLPNIPIGAIIAVPLVFGLIFFILGKRGGD